MNRILLTPFCAAFLATSAYADENTPDACPHPNAIKAAQFVIQNDFTTSDGRKFYLATQEDQKYDTNWKNEWHIEIFDIQATSTQDAKQQLNEALPFLSLKSGPTKSPFGWVCDYTLNGWGASAYTGS
jgi:hypothetical protein